MSGVDVRIDKGIARLGKLPDDVLAELKTEARARAATLRAAARAKASGDVLKVRTGAYVKSIRTSVRTSKKGVKGRLYSKSPLANILEGGATIPAHVIEPKNANALAFIAGYGMYGVSQVFAARVMDPGGKISPRSVIFSTFREEKSDIEQGLRDAVKRGTQANGATA